LDRVIDAAIEITGAERGFILLKETKASKSPIAGFDVKVARNLNREMLRSGDFELSSRSVKQAIDKAAYVLTDDALSDPRFSEKKSVMDYRLRSVLVVSPRRGRQGLRRHLPGSSLPTGLLFRGGPGSVERPWPPSLAGDSKGAIDR
jgi:hypothetical protein